MATFEGTNGPDRYAGPRGQKNTITGYAGDDTLTGGDLSDTISGGAGSDLIAAGAGNDIVYLYHRGGNPTPNARNTADLGAGVDEVYGGGEVDAMNGGDGFDYLSYFFAPAAVSVSIEAGRGTAGHARGDTFRNVEGVVGSDFADTLRGDAGDNWLDGVAGNDQLAGGAGDDSLRGDAGFDRLDGGAGFDYANYQYEAAAVSVDLGRGRGFAGDARGDTYVGVEGAVGTDFADTLVGGRGDNDLYGQKGADRLAGGAGRDVLSGGLGADRLTGGAGADNFFLETLRDSTVALAGRDRVEDFGQGTDALGLDRLDADARQAGDQAFAFIGERAFTGAAGQLRYAQDGGDTVVYGDVNGDKRADFAVQLDGLIDLQRADFML